VILYSTDMSPGHQCDPVYHPVLAFFTCDICVVFFVVLCCNNRKSTVTTIGRLVKSSQQHNRFLNNVQYSNFAQYTIMARHGTAWITGSDVNRIIGSPSQKSEPVTQFRVRYSKTEDRQAN
jgi:hypothetical protein